MSKLVLKSLNVAATTSRQAISSDAIYAQTIVIENADNSALLYVGGDNVTTSNGLEVEKGERLQLEQGASRLRFDLSQIYVIASASCDCRILYTVSDS